jgi:hypothetical protein
VKEKDQTHEKLNHQTLPTVSRLAHVFKIQNMYSHNRGEQERMGFHHKAKKKPRIGAANYSLMVFCKGALKIFLFAVWPIETYQIIDVSAL